MNTDLSLYRADVRAEIERNITPNNPRPFYAEDMALTWAAMVTFEKQKCDEYAAKYAAFPDKRVSEARHIKAVWNRRCARLHFFRIYAAEQVAASLT